MTDSQSPTGTTKEAKASSSSPPPPSIPLPIKIISILGPPGSGKGTQCNFLTTRYNNNDNNNITIEHVSVGEVLRAEMTRDGGSSPWARILRENMLEGRVGDKEMTVGILGDYIRGKVSSSSSSPSSSLPPKKMVFLLDGFPRSLDRALYFEKSQHQQQQVGGMRLPLPPISLIIHLTVPSEEILIGRLKERKRFDDVDEEVIKKRIRTYREETVVGVIEEYSKEGKVRTVDGDREVGEVSRELEGIFDEVLFGEEKEEE